MLDQLDELQQSKKQQDKGIFDAVTEDMSEDYLSYINDLVKATKTPVKGTSKEKFDNKQHKDLELLKKQELKIQKSSPNRTKREISETDIYQRINFKRDERPKFFSNYQPINPKYEPVRQTTGSESATRLLRELQARKSRPSLPIKQRLVEYDKEQTSNLTFLECIAEYVNQLQSENPIRTTKMDEIMAENKKLRKKLNIYEQKFKQIQKSHLKAREKQYKSKIKHLSSALRQAVDKTNQQKDEIDYLQGFLNNFTHQVKAYKHNRTNKEKLTQLLVKQRQYRNKRLETTIDSSRFL